MTEPFYRRNNEITAPRVRGDDGRPVTTLNRSCGRTVVVAPLRAVDLRGGR